MTARRGQTRLLDESDVRVRPSRRGSRPRTKDRPVHADATPGWVAGVDRGRYQCVVPVPPALADEPPVPGTPAGDQREVTAVRARELRPSDVAVGDVVSLVGDLTGAPGTLARLVRVRPRRSSLRRTADDADPVERVVVANADQVCVVVSIDDPPARPRLVDRALVAAWDAGVDPLLCVTKVDLADPGRLLATYADVALPAVLVSTVTGRGVDDLAAALAERVTAMVGPSGVGKSTLVNLLTGSRRRTGVVNAVTGRGRHTSVSAVALPLLAGGWAVDTPGVRSFGLAHVRPDHLLDAFDDLAPGTADCPRACDHDNPDCALDAFVGAGGAGPAGSHRLDSYRRMLRALRAED